jgi:hypothetical protein
MAMMKNILVRLAVSVALSVGTPALAKDGNVTAKHHATVAREVAARGRVDPVGIDLACFSRPFHPVSEGQLNQVAGI